MKIIEAFQELLHIKETIHTAAIVLMRVDDAEKKLKNMGIDETLELHSDLLIAQAGIEKILAAMPKETK